MVVSNGSMNGRPMICIGRIYREGSDSKSVGCFYLISHQGKERRNNQGWSTTAIAQNSRGNEVDRALPPPCSFNDEKALLSVNKRINCFPLAIAEISLRIIERLLEKIKSIFFLGHLNGFTLCVILEMAGNALI